ncbi:DUF1820 family protein [Aliagarivorans taiwanensis]|uniref:DUF1820 family protein n=1 Tax=Aliagarivorans taiwanensis TaxID=561966 RepID=UPI003CCC3F5C
MHQRPRQITFSPQVVTMDQVYRVLFNLGDKRYEVYVKEVTQSSLFGFIELADFVFDNHAQLLVDPSEEKLKSEFSKVQRTFVPMHSILRIDAVEKAGPAKIQEQGSVTPFPGPIYTPSQS